MSLSLPGLQTGTILLPMTIIGNDGPRPLVGCQLFKHLSDKYDLDIIVGRLKVANSHTAPQLHRCIRGPTDGSIRLRADLLQTPPGSVNIG